MSGPISTLFVIAVPTRRTTSPTSRLSVKSGMCSPCCSSAATGTTTGMSRDRLLTSGHVISCSSITCLPFVLSLRRRWRLQSHGQPTRVFGHARSPCVPLHAQCRPRSEEHTSELQSPCNLVCRLLLEKKKKKHRLTHLTPKKKKNKKKNKK